MMMNVIEAGAKIFSIGFISVLTIIVAGCLTRVGNGTWVIASLLEQKDSENEHKFNHDKLVEFKKYVPAVLIAGIISIISIALS